MSAMVEAILCTAYKSEVRPVSRTFPATLCATPEATSQASENVLLARVDPELPLPSRSPFARWAIPITPKTALRMLTIFSQP